MRITAAVLPSPGADFRLQTLDLAGPGPCDVLVRISGVGLCGTDLAVRRGHLPFRFPAVLGHEGSGMVEAVGRRVSRVRPGDRVVLSFARCGRCSPCRDGLPAYCDRFRRLNFGGTRPDGTPGLRAGSTPVGSNWFGQSSLATHAVVDEAVAVPVRHDLPLELAGPLGCGVQTGAGAVLTALDCRPGSTLLVAGGGSVGLSAVLAAAVRGLAAVVVSEPVQARRRLALALGATHVVDPADGPISEQVRAAVPGGVATALDTTASAQVLRGCVGALATRGKLGLLGVPTDRSARLDLGMLDLQSRGLTVVGVVEGDADPHRFIPHLLDLHQQGRFPFDRLITTMPWERINDAVTAQADGTIVKAVLVPGDVP